MDNIIDKLYELHLANSSHPLGTPHKENTYQEWELYLFLYEKLTGEYREAFLKYVDLQSTRQDNEIRTRQ